MCETNTKYFVIGKTEINYTWFEYLFYLNQNLKSVAFEVAFEVNFPSEPLPALKSTE